MPLLLLLLLRPAVGDLLSWGPGMARLVAMEGELVAEARRHADHLEAALTAVEEYVREVHQVYGGCPGGACDEETMMERVLGNPIYNYQLLKRVTVYWANVEKAISRVDREDTLSRIRKIKRRNRELPTESDLQSAARSLTYLAEVYALSPGEVVQGSLLGHTTGARLAPRDTHYLARNAALQGNHVLASGLAEAALASVNINNTSKTQVGAMRLLLQQEKDKVQEGWAAGRPEYILGQIPQKTSDWKKLTTEQDKTNFRGLCRGERLLSPAMEARLFCHYSHQANPYLRLHPIPVEVLHEEPHKVVMFHSVLSPEECRQLGRVAASRLKQSAIGQAKQLSDIRVSRNAWLEDGVHPLVDRLNRRTDQLTGLQGSSTSAVHGDPARREEFELLQVAEYGIGGHYNVHQDPMFVYKDSTYLADSVEAKVPYPTGDRMSTLMFYLSDVEAGGITAFPRLGVAAAPAMGSAIFWHNLHRSGASDMAMLHGGCPVLLGSKLVANKWMREVAQVLHRPCALAREG